MTLTKTLVLTLLSAALCTNHVLALPARRTAVVDVYEKVSPAVVNIATERTVRKRSYPFQGSGTIEDFFFGIMNPEIKEENVPLSIGTGVIIDSTGIVLTNEHILYRASAITVTLNDGRKYNAQVLGSDSATDIAVLKLESADKTPFPWVKPGDSSDIMIGERIVAIGNPFGLQNTVTQGVVSALKRRIVAEERVYTDFIQIDASINPGNSGGPLLNIQGSLIGINTAIYSGGRGREAEGIGFATPINLAKRVVDDLLRFGRVVPAYLGFRVWFAKGRVWVMQVSDQGPAGQAGLREGDWIKSCHGTDISSTQDFRAVVTRLKPGSILDCIVLRNGKSKQVDIKSAHFPENFYQSLSRYVFGVDFVEDKNALRIARVYRNLPAERVGLRPGDRVMKINDTPLTSLDVFRSIAANLYYRSEVLVVIERGGSLYYATLSLHP